MLFEFESTEQKGIKIKKINLILEGKIRNFFLRMCVLAGKFISMVLFAKLMPQAELGLYGLVVAYAALAVLIYGMDFYTYTHRVYFNPGKKAHTLLTHAKISCTLIVFYTISGWFYLKNDVFDGSTIVLMLILFSVEYVSQEMYRYFILENKQTVASTGLLLRTTAWMVPLVMVGLVLHPISIEMIIIFWIIGGVLSIFYYIKNCKNISSINLNFSVSGIRVWLVNGVTTSLIYFVATVSLKLIFTIDKKAVQFYSGLEALGTYTFITSFSMVAYTICDAIILSYYYPLIIGEKISASLYNSMLIKVGVVSTATSILIYFFLGLVVYLFEINPSYLDYSTFIYSSIAVVFFTSSMIPHFFLYANSKDKVLMGANLFCGFFAYVIFDLFSNCNTPVVASQKMALVLFLLFIIKHVIFCVSQNRSKWII